MTPRNKPDLGKKDAKLTILIVLSIGGGLLALNRFQPASTSAAMVPPRATAVQKLETRWSPPIAVNWPQGVHRDPFEVRIAVVAVAEAPEIPSADPSPTSDDIRREAKSNIRVGGILFSKHPKTLLNGSLCTVGDVIGGYRVHRIERNAIIVEKDGTLVTISP